MKKSVVVGLHLLYWSTYLFVLFLIYVSSQQDKQGIAMPGPIMLHVWLSSVLVPGLISFYSCYTFVFSRFLKQKKVLRLILSGLTIFLIGAVAEDIYVSIIPGPGLFAGGSGSFIGLSIVFYLIALVNGIMGFILKGFITWYEDIKLKAELSKKNHEMELALVKSQINPHFLFNTINNIDVLIQKDAAKASAYLNKLSDIMRFMLYETKTETIPLKQELEYIEKYIDLQKIRTSNPNYVNYSVQGDAGNSMIAPMLFIPFIENAFKHAENKRIENAINIRVVIENGKILFDCENSYSTDTQTKLGHSGLGNELIQKRLNLLYSGKHTLEIFDDGKTYKVKLTISGN